MAIEVEVSSARCIGSKTCLHAAAGVFHIEGGAAIVVDPEAAPEADVLRAADGCPTGAITVFKDGRKIS